MTRPLVVAILGMLVCLSAVCTSVGDEAGVWVGALGSAVIAVTYIARATGL